MAIEPRQPPSQLVAKLQRLLGGSAGWSGFVVQILFVAVLAWIACEIVGNARAIVTFNQRDFQPAASTFGIDVWTPADAIRRLR